MKVLVDAQLPPALALWLRDKGVEADHVGDLGLLKATDHAIWNLAVADDYVLMSKDRDFADWAFVRSPHPQIVWVRRGNQGTTEMLAWLEDAWPRIVESLAEGARVVEAGR